MYSLGDEWLDRLLGTLEPGSLLLVLGYPGAGKTSFTAKMVYVNSLKHGVKSLYISFSETKEKFFKFMSRLGLDFDSLESRGLFWFVEMPLKLGREDFESLSHLVSSLASEGDFSIVVVDTVNPLLERARTRSEARTFLHDLLYRPVSKRKGVLVLVAELPLGREALELGGVEFVADAVLVFKSEVVRSEMIRFVEVRKFRGSSVKAYRIPFVIEEGGFRALLGPVLARSRAELGRGRRYSTGCGLLDTMWSPGPGKVILVSLEPSAAFPYTLVELISSLAKRAGLNPVLASFSPAYTVVLEEIAARVKDAELVTLYPPSNPYRVLDELISRVYGRRRGMVVLAGLGALLKSFADSQVELVKLVGEVLVWLKQSGVLTLIISCDAGVQELVSEYVDVVHSIRVAGKELVHVVAGRVGSAIEVRDSELAQCIRRGVEGLCLEG